jgi:uncharacterized protein YdiU (UPF0061 family)
MNITQLKRINFNNVAEWKEQSNPIEKYKIDEDEFSDDEAEEEAKLIHRREKNNYKEESSSESSDNESDSEDRVDQKEKQKENQNKKLEKFHEEIRAIYEIINGKEIKNLSAIKTQLSRDIIPLHVKNSKRKEEIINQIKKCENTKQLTELLKYWINEFSVVFKYELTSATK